jgi:hypothetical protein
VLGAYRPTPSQCGSLLAASLPAQAGSGNGLMLSASQVTLWLSPTDSTSSSASASKGVYGRPAAADVRGHEVDVGAYTPRLIRGPPQAGWVTKIQTRRTGVGLIELVDSHERAAQQVHLPTGHREGRRAVDQFMPGRERGVRGLALSPLDLFQCAHREGEAHRPASPTLPHREAPAAGPVGVLSEDRSQPARNLMRQFAGSVLTTRVTKRLDVRGRRRRSFIATVLASTHRASIGVQNRGPWSVRCSLATAQATRLCDQRKPSSPSPERRTESPRKLSSVSSIRRTRRSTRPRPRS